MYIFVGNPCLNIGYQCLNKHLYVQTTACSSRQTMFLIFRINTTKIGMNTTANKLTCLNIVFLPLVVDKLQVHFYICYYGLNVPMFESVCVCVCVCVSAGGRCGKPFSGCRGVDELVRLSNPHNLILKKFFTFRYFKTSLHVRATLPTANYLSMFCQKY